MSLRENSIKLLHSWVSNESLRRHCYAVAAAMEGYAKNNGLSEEECEKWYICGLLHDMDYEKFPSLEHHPHECVKVLKELGYSNEIINAILGHGNHTGVKRESTMAKTLFAIDELCGLVVALSKVRSDGFSTMTTESIEKALKKKGFAAAISREDIEQGIKELGIDRTEHFESVIDSLRVNKVFK